MSDMGGPEPAPDLFDQWLAHHEGRVPEVEQPDPEPAFAAESDPTPVPEPEPEPEPQVQPPLSPEPGFPPLPTDQRLPDQHAAGASVLAALTGEPPAAPAPRSAAPVAPPTPSDSGDEPHRPSHLAPAAPPTTAGLPDQHAAAASVVAALQPDQPTATQAPARDVPSETTTAKAPKAPRLPKIPKPPKAPKAERRPATTEPAEPATPAAPVAADQPAASVGVRERPAALPHTIFFKPRRGTTRLLSGLLLVFVAATVAAALWAWQDRTFLSYGVTGVAALVAAVIWATRASASPTRLTLRGSELEIVRNGSRAVFDLAARHTPIEVRGEPGTRGWKVLILRRSMSPFVIDASMVDPRQFTQVLRFYRPEV